MNKNFLNLFNLISHILILNDSDFLYIYNIDIKVTKSCKVSFSVVGPIFVSIRPISTRYHDTVNLVPVQPTLDSWHITLYVGTLYRFFKSIFIITSLFQIGFGSKFFLSDLDPMFSFHQIQFFFLGVLVNINEDQNLFSEIVDNL